jgi:hypothetical protein
MLVARALKNSQVIRPLPDEILVTYGTGHLNQSRRDRAARDTIGLDASPQLEGEAVNAFFLPRLRLDRNTGLKRKRNVRGFIHPELNDPEEGVGFIV